MEHLRKNPTIKRKSRLTNGAFCALAQNARGILDNYNFFIPEKYNHKKFIKAINKKEDFWCTYDLHKYAQSQWFDDDWKK